MDKNDNADLFHRPRPEITVLSIDGGGVRGVAAAAFLRRLEERLGVDAGQVFGYYAGASAGGLIVLHLCVNGKTAADAVNLFSDDYLKRIMPKNLLTRWMPVLLFRPKYDGTGKTEVLKEVFGARKLQDARRAVLVTAVDMARHRVWVYKSMGGRASAQAPYAWQAADATSAAPVIFPPVKTNGSLFPRYLIDGGVSSNDPSMCLLAELLKLNYKPEQIRMLSVGTGIKAADVRAEARLAARAKRWGVLDWISNGLILQLQDGAASGVSHWCSQILGDTNYLRINGPLGDASPSIDDTRPANIERLTALGESWFDGHETEIRSLLAPALHELGEPDLMGSETGSPGFMELPETSSPSTTCPQEQF